RADLVEELVEPRGEGAQRASFSLEPQEHGAREALVLAGRDERRLAAVEEGLVAFHGARPLGERLLHPRVREAAGERGAAPFALARPGRGEDVVAKRHRMAPSARIWSSALRPSFVDAISRRRASFFASTARSSWAGSPSIHALATSSESRRRRTTPPGPVGAPSGSSTRLGRWIGVGRIAMPGAGAWRSGARPSNVRGSNAGSSRRRNFASS